MKIRDLPTHSRPREKLIEKGSAALSDTELLALILRTGYQGKSAKEVAQRILTKYSLKQLIQMPLSNLLRIKGIGRSRAAIISVINEIHQRTHSSNLQHQINNASDVVKVCHFLRHKKREYLVTLCLNARNELIQSETISIGTLTTGLVHPREVFLPAIKLNTARVIAVHNHPSGDEQPSQEDHTVTQRLVRAGRILGIEFVDHIIITAEHYFSFREESPQLFIAKN